MIGGVQRRHQFADIALDAQKRASSKKKGWLDSAQGIQILLARTGAGITTPLGARRSTGAHSLSKFTILSRSNCYLGDEVEPRFEHQPVLVRYQVECRLQISDLVDDAALIAVALHIRLRHARDGDSPVSAIGATYGSNSGLSQVT